MGGGYTPARDLLTTSHFDAVIGDPTSPAMDVTIAGFLKILSTTSGVVGETAMTGAENTVYQVLQSDVESYEAPIVVEGYLDLATMQAGDTIVVRESSTIEGYTNWRVYADHTYTGVQDEPLVHFTKKLAGNGYRVTAEQTGGTNRTLRNYFYRRRIK